MVRDYILYLKGVDDSKKVKNPCTTARAARRGGERTRITVFVFFPLAFTAYRIPDARLPARRYPGNRNRRFTPAGSFQGRAANRLQTGTWLLPCWRPVVKTSGACLFSFFVLRVNDTLRGYRVNRRVFSPSTENAYAYTYLYIYKIKIKYTHTHIRARARSKRTSSNGTDGATARTV